MLGGPKEREARKVFRLEMKASRKAVAGSDFNSHKGRGKDQKGKGKEGAHPQPGLSASKTLSGKGNGMPWGMRRLVFKLLA